MWRLFHTVWCDDRQSVEKREIHCHANSFRQINFLVKFFSKKILSRNFCKKMVAVKFHNFHTVLYNVRLDSEKKSCEINFQNEDMWLQILFPRNIFQDRSNFLFAARCCTNKWCYIILSKGIEEINFTVALNFNKYAMLRN